MDLTVLEQFLSEGIQRILGSPEAVGVFALITFVVYAIFAGLDMTLALIVLIPLIVALGASGWLNPWVAVAVAGGLAFILFSIIRNSMER